MLKCGVHVKVCLCVIWSFSFFFFCICSVITTNQNEHKHDNAEKTSIATCYRTAHLLGASNGLCGNKDCDGDDFAKIPRGGFPRLIWSKTRPVLLLSLLIITLLRLRLLFQLLLRLISDLNCPTNYACVLLWVRQLFDDFERCSTTSWCEVYHESISSPRRMPHLNTWIHVYLRLEFLDCSSLTPLDNWLI